VVAAVVVGVVVDGRNYGGIYCAARRHNKHVCVVTDISVMMAGTSFRNANVDVQDGAFCTRLCKKLGEVEQVADKSGPFSETIALIVGRSPKKCALFRICMHSLNTHWSNCSVLYKPTH
jgi:hypothetical protein